MWLTTKKFTILSILVLYLLFGPENGSSVVGRNNCSLPLCAEKCTYYEAYILEQNLIEFRDKIANEKARKGVTNELLFRVGKYFCNPVPPTNQSSFRRKLKFTFANCVKSEP